MDGYERTGPQGIRETKASIPVGITLALLIWLAVILFIFGISLWGGLMGGIIAFFILRYFRVRKIEHLMLSAALMFISIITMIYIIGKELKVPEEDLTVSNIMEFGMLVVFPFVLLSILIWWMRRNLEKVRARLEAEGRLYPPGYGRCKRCGTIVLPGEVACRRCGEYVDVPEHLRVKKINYFECSECGREVPEDAGVCPFCGEAFDDDQKDGQKEA